MNRTICDDGFGNDCVWHGGFDARRLAWKAIYYYWSYLLGSGEGADLHYDLC